MHLAQGIGTHHQNPFYNKTAVLTRPDTLPYLFRKLRIHKNITRSRFAEKFSVSESYVYQVESGYRFPSLRYCLKCGDFFGANAQCVKRRWAREAVKRYQESIYKRIGLDWWGGET